MAPVFSSWQRPLALLMASSLALAACKNDDTDGSNQAEEVTLTNRSKTPALIKKLSGFDNLDVFSLIGSNDTLPESPGFVFGGSADGYGLLKTESGFLMLTNHEDNFAVSRVYLDKTFKPVKGEYILNSDGGIWRLCSATLATPEEHGFGPTYLTSGESGVESRTHALNPFLNASYANFSQEAQGLGRWSAENAVPLPKEAYPGKTVILIGDDDSGPAGGQLALYFAEQVGNLATGDLYMLKRTDGNQRERAMVTDQTYAVEFAKIDNHQSLTGNDINGRVDVLQAIEFGRVEDIDYRKGGGANGREIYFNATGQQVNDPGNANNNTSDPSDANSFPRTRKGRTYKLTLNTTNPTQGTLEVILDGDDDNGPANEFQNVDNICVTQNFAYIQEDPNTYGDETHDSYVYQYNLTTKELKKVFELDHRRNEAQYNVTNTPERRGSWEYGALVDISDLVGIENTFALCVQPHTWLSDRFKKADGGSKRPDEKQGSQILIVRGLPR